MYVVNAQLVARPGQEEVVADAMRAMVPASRAEAGCLMYLAHRSLDDPRRFMFYEQYVDEAAFQAHTQTEHYQRWVVGLIAPNLEDRQRGIFGELD
jgi:(4S)-4-hydroxy-5-phosphonooxypentane-2,3-dione isomerase